ncbi:MAG: DUF2330 domain-containing protein [Phormidesmis sp.]
MLKELVLKELILKDARDYQIVFLTLFLGLGVAMRDWTLRPEMVGVAVVSALSVQFLLSVASGYAGAILGRWTGYCTQFEWPAVNWRSPLITALGLSLLLRTDHLWTMGLAAGAAIASKFLFKTQEKHFFNPANFGIVAAIALTQDAWISPGQWGEDMWYGFIFLGAGGLVLKRVGRWDTTGMFLGSYALMEALRNFYLGWTWDVWAHRMMSGALLLFALFMVTDPRSIPNARPARLVWAGAITLLTFTLRNTFYLTTAPFWALFLLAPLTIVLDRAWAAPRFEWRQVWQRQDWRPKAGMVVSSLLVLFFFSFTQPAQAFCGFYVAKADTDLYNRASEVAIARDGNRTVLTMANDFQGSVSDFAMVVPVPTVIQQAQVSVAEPAVLKRLDDFSAPRMVEYFDSDPCQVMQAYRMERQLSSRAREEMLTPSPAATSDLGVTVEEQFSVGEYDILILSAQESDGLETWLRQNDYRLPEGASAVLAPYIRQDMKFFVAKVNLEEFDESEFKQLRHLQIAYDSPRFMLPIRLGMLNADAAQDLVVYLLSPNGRAELTNYRTVNIPTDEELPLFVQKEFGSFYPQMFQRRYETEGKEVAFLEYAWDSRNCDPCSATPLTAEELRAAGAFWVNADTPNRATTTQKRNGAFITRLHVRYSRDKFPEDLIFQATGNQQLFQGRYVTRHPFDGNINCTARLQEDRPTREPILRLEAPSGEAISERQASAAERGEAYNRALTERFEREAQTLSRLTGQPVQPIRQRISDEVPQPTPSRWLVLHPKSDASTSPRRLGWGNES